MLDNERLQVDFTPLYQCIHIYGALDAIDEIRRSYQADRKVSVSYGIKKIQMLKCVAQAQSDLIIPDTLSLSNLFSVTQEIVGFFIIETHVLNTTGSFRSEREVEELWDALLTRLTTVVENALKKETDADSFLRVKESLMGFVMTLEVKYFYTSSATVDLRLVIQAYSYSTTSLHAFIMVLFERYVTLLEKQFGKRFEDVSFVEKLNLLVLT